ncbi:MAG TPA: hypothetical protein VLC46_18900 [Thermoanaerobaculia bacterium]|jgi:hypothetical protein|nr:hypothetical protein [Thermoanaerobaculia bacterium]
MSSFRIVICCVLLSAVAGSYAQSEAGPEAALRRLYAAHQPWAQKDVLSDGTLGNYFDEKIVRLVKADQECKAPDWGVGNLDFDPILDGQDYGDTGIGDLQIRRIGDGKANRYEVSFLLFPGESKDRTHLVYSLAKSAGRWRITDIQYEETTLLKILAPPCK